MILFFTLFILILVAFFLRSLTSQTSDILFLVALEIKKEIINSKTEILASNQYIIDILETKRKK